MADLFNAAETAESMADGKPRAKKVRPVGKTAVNLITSLKEELHKEAGADFTLHIEVQGQRVADYSMVLGWLPPKEI